MRFLKNVTVAAFLAASAVSGSAIVATPAQAATPAQVQALVVTRVSQLQALIADQDAIINNPASTSAQIIEAQATKQRIVFRVAQLNAISTAANSLPPINLDAVANYLQAVISAA